MIEAYPLSWPVGYPRTGWPKYSRFEKHTLSKATNAVLKEINLLIGSNKSVVISSNVPLRKDGLPRSDYSRRNIDDKGVAVYWTKNGCQQVIACDRWDRVECNMWAVYLTISAIRAQARHGCSNILDGLLSGLRALPENAGPDAHGAEAPPYVHLELDQEPFSYEIAKKARNRVALKHHRDSRKLLQINQAFEYYKKKFNAKK